MTGKSIAMNLETLQPLGIYASMLAIVVSVVGLTPQPAVFRACRAVHREAFARPDSSEAMAIVP